MATKRAVTLIELMIIVALLGILAALVVPVIADSSDRARIEAIATNTAHIRTMIVHHAGKRDVPLSAGGYPQAVDPAWFQHGRMPEHAWSERPMIVETVTLGMHVLYPQVKTFDRTQPAAATAWYNATNGAFCVRVPVQPTDAQTLEVFNDCNKSGAAALAATN